MRRFNGFDMLLRMLLRLRWLFLAIVVLYGWMSPGQALFPGMESLSPSREGVMSGLQRLSGLVLIMSSASYLLACTNQRQLFSGLYSLLSPVSLLGLSRDKIVLRLALTMNSVQAIRSIVSAAATTKHPTGFLGLPTRLAEAFARVIQAAETATLDVVEIEVLAPPAAWQWGLPALCGVVFHLLHAIG